jgi:hypothetical protein
MPVTIVLASVIISGSVRADLPAPHVTATVVARAQILSGVRVGEVSRTVDPAREIREAPPPKPRERPCPEREATPCRLMVVDME